jgi:hypothetical protein
MYIIIMEIVGGMCTFAAGEQQQVLAVLEQLVGLVGGGLGASKALDHRARGAQPVHRVGQCAAAEPAQVQLVHLEEDSKYELGFLIAAGDQLPLLLSVASSAIDHPS